MSHRLWRYVREGPPAGDSVAERMVAYLLHWRTWGMALCFMGGVYAVTLIAPSDHGMLGWMIGLATAIVASWVAE